MTFKTLLSRPPAGPLESFLTSLKEPSAILDPESAPGWAAISRWGHALVQTLAREGAARDPKRQPIAAYIALSADLAERLAAVLGRMPDTGGGGAAAEVDQLAADTRRQRRRLESFETGRRTLARVAQ